MADVNFKARDALYLGDFQAAAQQADVTQGDGAMVVGLAQLASGAQLNLSSAPSSSATRLLNALQQSIKSTAQVNEDAVQAARDALADPVAASNNDARFIAALILAREGRLDEAYKAAVKTAQEKHLESAALAVQILLAINRPDVASQHLNTIASWSSDSALAQLCEVWVNAATVGSDSVAAVQDAYFAFEELAQTYGQNATLLNNMAACQIIANNPAEAEHLLMDAYEKVDGFSLSLCRIPKLTHVAFSNPQDKSNANTLANLIVLCSLLNKPFDEYLSALRQQHPKHTMAQDYQAKSDMFDRAAARYA
ncbi:hypothetical protein RI367_005603 [Sorochytrium milnesiophthora]